jgi:biopolymer transport protein ExbD
MSGSVGASNSEVRFQLMQVRRPSPIRSVQALCEGGSATTGKALRRSKSLTQMLPLTSLIDAFSIIVIYLLIATQVSGPDLSIPNRLQLPTALSSAEITEAPIVQIVKGQFLIKDQPVARNQLGRALFELRRELESQGQKDIQIIVQADQAMDYVDLNPLLRASSEAGLQKLKFAVMPVLDQKSN